MIVVDGYTSVMVSTTTMYYLRHIDIVCMYFRVYLKYFLLQFLFYLLLMIMVPQILVNWVKVNFLLSQGCTLYVSCIIYV